MANVRWREITKNGQIIIEEIHKVVVHRFRMGDVEDPQLFAAEPIYKWQQTDGGKFVMQNAIDEPIFHTNLNPEMFGYDCIIVAELESKKLTEYLLRFNK